MRAITVHQPWAWAIIHGGKDVENRSHNIAGSYRGPVAIHAGKTYDDEASWNDAWESLSDALDAEGSPPWDAPWNDNYGHIIGVVDLVDVHHAEDCWTADMLRLKDLYANDRQAYDALPATRAGGLIGKTRMCSPWALSGRHHLVLANPRPLPTPIPCRGRLGLWTVPEDIAARIEATS